MTRWSQSHVCPPEGNGVDLSPGLLISSTCFKSLELDFSDLDMTISNENGVEGLNVTSLSVSPLNLQSGRDVFLNPNEKLSTRDFPLIDLRMPPTACTCLWNMCGLVVLYSPFKSRITLSEREPTCKHPHEHQQHLHDKTKDTCTVRMEDRLLVQLMVLRVEKERNTAPRDSFTCDDTACITYHAWGGLQARKVERLLTWSLLP